MTIVDIEPDRDQKNTQPSSVAREGAEQVTIPSCAGRGPRQGGRVRPPAIANPRVSYPSRSEARLQPCSLLDSLERSDGSGCYSVLDLEAPKGSVECVHQFRRPLLSSREHPSLPALLRSRHPTQRHRRLTRTHRGRSQYPGQMSRRWSTTRRRAATPRNLRGRLVPFTTISTCPAQWEQTRRFARRSRRRTAGPSRRGRARPDGYTPCTTLSAAHRPQRRRRVSSAGGVGLHCGFWRAGSPMI
jgi:hypothetical protein